MEPETVRDALQRLSEVQVLQEHLPPEVVILRMNELARITAGLVHKQGAHGSLSPDPEHAPPEPEPPGPEPAAA